MEIGGNTDAELNAENTLHAFLFARLEQLGVARAGVVVGQSESTVALFLCNFNKLGGRIYTVGVGGM